MSRISRNNVLRAIKAVQEMGTDQKRKLADEIFASQPNLLGSVLVLPSLGVSLAKQEFALEMLLLCFQAMKESGLMWPLIAEDEQANQMRRHSAILRFYASLDGSAEKTTSPPAVHRGSSGTGPAGLGDEGDPGLAVEVDRT